MSLIVKDSGGSVSEPLEAGTYLARCVGVIDIGFQYNSFTGKEQNRVRIVFEIPSERVEIDGDALPRWMSKTYTASLHERANLRKDLDNWRGRPFTEEELEGFNLTNIIGAPCMLTIAHKQSTTTGTNYAVIAGISRVMKGLEVPPQEWESMIFDMDDKETYGTMDKLPQWMRDEIKNSKSWKPTAFDELAATVEENFGDDETDGELPF